MRLLFVSQLDVHARCRLIEARILVQAIQTWEESIYMGRKVPRQKCHSLAPWQKVCNSGISPRNLMSSNVSYKEENYDKFIFLTRPLPAASMVKIFWQISWSCLVILDLHAQSSSICLIFLKEISFNRFDSSAPPYMYGLIL